MSPQWWRVAIPPLIGLLSFLGGLKLTQWLVTPRHMVAEADGGGYRLIYYLLHDVGWAHQVVEAEPTGPVAWWTFAYASRSKHPDFPTEPDVWWYLTPSVYRGTGSWQLPMTTELVPMAVLPIVPIGVLVLSGAMAALLTVRSNRLRDGGLAGASIAVGYLLATLVGLFLPFVSFASRPNVWVVMFPDPVVSLVRMGIAYPLTFGTVGGITAIGLRRVIRTRRG